MTRLFAGTPFDRPPTCENCNQAVSACRCPPAAAKAGRAHSQGQVVQLSTERRRKGKLVTVIRGLESRANDLPALLTKLKNSCGAGGTLDGEALELQGDHRERLRLLLGEMGFKVKG